MSHLNTFTRGGNTFMRKKGKLYVLCNDSKFRRIDEEKFNQNGAIELDPSHDVFYEPVELYD